MSEAHLYRHHDITVSIHSIIKAFPGPVSRVLKKRKKNDRSKGGVDGLGARG